MMILKTKPTRISHSSIQLFQLCPYKYYLQKVKRIEPIKRHRALDFGTAFHEALEAWWSCSGSVEQAYVAALDVWLRVSAPKYHLSPEDVVIGKVLLRGYSARWGTGPRARREHIEEIKVVPVLSPSGEPDPELQLKGILDISDPAVDHKTTTSLLGPDSPYWSRLERDPQPTIYLIIGDDTGANQDCIVWDVIRAPQLKPRKATPIEKRKFYVRGSKDGSKKPGDPKPGTYLTDETIPEFEERFAAQVEAAPDEFFVRETIRKTESQKEQTRYDIWAAGRLIRAAEQQEAFPRNTKSCDAFNRDCEYFDICHRGASPDNGELYRIRKRDA